VEIAAALSFQGMSPMAKAIIDNIKIILYLEYGLVTVNEVDE